MYIVRSKIDSPTRRAGWSNGTHLGSTIPTAVPVKENDPEKTFTFEGISGKNLFVGVPGAFSGTCSAQIPGYIKSHAEFKDRGIKDIYVVGVNDVFTMKAWKEQLASSGTRTSAPLSPLDVEH